MLSKTESHKLQEISILDLNTDRGIAKENYPAIVKELESKWGMIYPRLKNYAYVDNVQFRRQYPDFEQLVKVAFGDRVDVLIPAGESSEGKGSGVLVRLRTAVQLCRRLEPLRKKCGSSFAEAIKDHVPVLVASLSIFREEQELHHLIDFIGLFTEYTRKLPRFETLVPIRELIMGTQCMAPEGAGDWGARFCAMLYFLREFNQRVQRVLQTKAVEDIVNDCLNICNKVGVVITKLKSSQNGIQRGKLLCANVEEASQWIRKDGVLLAFLFTMQQSASFSLVAALLYLYEIIQFSEKIHKNKNIGIDNIFATLLSFSADQARQIEVGLLNQVSELGQRRLQDISLEQLLLAASVHENAERWRFGKQGVLDQLQRIGGE